MSRECAVIGRLPASFVSTVIVEAEVLAFSTNFRPPAPVRRHRVEILKLPSTINLTPIGATYGHLVEGQSRLVNSQPL